MFYADFLFVKRGPLSKVWQVAHLSKKLSRRDIRETNVVSAVQAIEQPQAPLALRSQGQLLLGLVRIYDGQVRYLQQDCTEAANQLSSLIDKRSQGAKGGHTEADPTQLVASAGAITVSDRDHLLLDGFDALEEQRYLEDHAYRMSSSQAADPNTSLYPSLSLSLSQSPHLSQTSQSLSQPTRPSDVALEQARRTHPSLGVMDDFELGEGMAMEEDMGFDLGESKEAGMDPEGGMELEVMRDEETEMGRVSMRDDTDASLLPLDGDAGRLSLLSIPGETTAQTAADEELIRRREERRLQRKRLRFAGEVRDEAVELESSVLAEAQRNTEDIVKSREEAAVGSARRRMLGRVTDLFTQSTVLGRIGDAQMDSLMQELFSVEGLKVPTADEGESKEGQEQMDQGQDVGLESLVGGDFDVGLGADDSYVGGDAEEKRLSPPSTPLRAPVSPTSAAASLLSPALPPPTRSDLEAIALSDEASTTAVHSFFNDPPTQSTVTSDSSTLSSRTVKTLSLLSSHFRSQGVGSTVSFEAMTPIPATSRAVAAGLFYQMLVLGQAGAVKCRQEEAFGDIGVSRGERFDEVAGRLGGGGDGSMGGGRGRRVGARG